MDVMESDNDEMNVSLCDDHNMVGGDCDGADKVDGFDETGNVEDESDSLSALVNDCGEVRTGDLGFGENCNVEFDKVVGCVGDDGVEIRVGEVMVVSDDNVEHLVVLEEVQNEDVMEKKNGNENGELIVGMEDADKSVEFLEEIKVANSVEVRVKEVVVCDGIVEPLVAGEEKVWNKDVVEGKHGINGNENGEVVVGVKDIGEKSVKLVKENKVDSGALLREFQESITKSGVVSDFSDISVKVMDGNHAASHVEVMENERTNVVVEEWDSLLNNLIWENPNNVDSSGDLGESGKSSVVKLQEASELTSKSASSANTKSEIDTQKSSATNKPESRESGELILKTQVAGELSDNSASSVEIESEFEIQKSSSINKLDMTVEDANEPEAEDSSCGTAYENILDSENETKSFHFLIKFPRLEDENLQEQISDVNQLVDLKNFQRDSIRGAIKRNKLYIKTLNDKFVAAISEKRDAMRLVNLKRQEIDSVQVVLNRVKNAISVQDTNNRIQHLEQVVEHKTLPSKEEGLIIREVKLVKQLRDQLSSNMGSPDEIRQALDLRHQFEGRLNVLKKELNSLKVKDSEAAKAVYLLGRKYDDEISKLRELQTQYKAVDGIIQKASKQLKGLKEQLHEKLTYFARYEDDYRAASDYALSGDKEALHCLCLNQVETTMEKWKKNDEFRKDYCRCNMTSTLRRLKSLDGRSLGHGEESSAPNIVTEIVVTRLSSPFKATSQPLILPLLEQKKLVEQEKSADQEKETEQENQIPVVKGEEANDYSIEKTTLNHELKSKTVVEQGKTMSVVKGDFAYSSMENTSTNQVWKSNPFIEQEMFVPIEVANGKANQLWKTTTVIEQGKPVAVAGSAGANGDSTTKSKPNCVWKSKSVLGQEKPFPLVEVEAANGKFMEKAKPIRAAVEQVKSVSLVKREVADGNSMEKKDPEHVVKSNAIVPQEKLVPVVKLEVADGNCTKKAKPDEVLEIKTIVELEIPVPHIEGEVENGSFKEKTETNQGLKNKIAKLVLEKSGSENVPCMVEAVKSIVVETEVDEILQTEEEMEMTKKAKMQRQEELAAQMKEQRRLEEKAKAQEALERKRRISEKAQLRAELRAQREAEQKEKEREKRLRKKEGKNIDGEVTPSAEESDSKDVPTTVTKPKKTVHYTKQIKKIEALPPALRNRGRKGLKQFMWWTFGALLVLFVFLVGSGGAFGSLKLRRDDNMFGKRRI